LLTVDDGEVKAPMETKKPHIKRREATTIPEAHKEFSLAHSSTGQWLASRWGFGWGVPVLHHRFFRLDHNP